MIKPKCNVCPFLMLVGTANVTGRNRHLAGPRSNFFCKHPDAFKCHTEYMKETRSCRSETFIGYSEPGKTVPAIKTCPKWCPLKKEEKR